MYHMRLRALPLFIGLLAASAPSVLLAVTPSFWTTSTFNEFSKGTLKGLTLNAEGQISLSPKFDSVFDTDQALIWSAAFDSKKNLYVGTGHDGKVFKVDVNGSSTVFFDAAELDVLALALDSEQTLFVATSPDGKIYRVNGDGKATVFFDPEDKFIWDMEFDKKGNLFVATGNKGRIYKVNKDGKGEIFYDSGQANILCLAIDQQGNIVAGSDPDGYLYRISPEGKPFVLYDSSMREIHEVQIDPQGNIYFIGINASPAGAIPQSKVNLTEGAPSESISVSVSVTPSTERTLVEEPTPNYRTPVARLGRRESGNLRSGIYRVSKDNHVESLWISDSETLFGLNLRPNGKVLLSTGNKGRIYLLDDLKKPTLLIETNEEQTTRLISGSSEVFACTSNLARIYRLSNGRQRRGRAQGVSGDLGWWSWVLPPSPSNARRDDRVAHCRSSSATHGSAACGVVVGISALSGRDAGKRAGRIPRYAAPLFMPTTGKTLETCAFYCRVIHRIFCFIELIYCSSTNAAAKSFASLKSCRRP